MKTQRNPGEPTKPTGTHRYPCEPKCTQFDPKCPLELQKTFYEFKEAKNSKRTPTIGRQSCFNRFFGFCGFG